jgi:hypothetical protein
MDPAFIRAWQDIQRRVSDLEARESVKTSNSGGATGDRPSSPKLYEFYFDTTLGIPIWHDGTNWVDATGSTV